MTDIKELEDEIIHYWHNQPAGMPMSGIGGITAALHYLEEKGLLK